MLCIKFVNYWDKYTEMHGQQNIKKVWNLSTCLMRNHTTKKWKDKEQSFHRSLEVEASWNVMTHPQKTYFVFRRNGRVHLNRWGRQFSRLLAAELCASAVVMLDTPCSEVAWRVLATHSISQFPFHFPSLRHRVPSHFNWNLTGQVQHQPLYTWANTHRYLMSRKYGQLRAGLNAGEQRKISYFCRYLNLVSLVL